MSIKKLPLFFFLFFFLLSTTTLCFGHQPSETRDPKRELEECYRQCESLRPLKSWHEACLEKCEIVYKEKQGEEDPRKELRECEIRCQQQAQTIREQRECKKRCQEKYEERQEGEGEGSKLDQEERKNPYYFSSKSFKTVFRNEEGETRILPKFWEKSELLRHLESYRFELWEANAHGFSVPYHAENERLFFVLQGRGTVTLVDGNKRESYNVERGDVMKLDAGSVVYTLNRDNREKLRTVTLVQSLNAPGEYEVYFGAGGENPPSYYRVFSDEVLEAAFNTPKDRLRKLFGQQNKGAVVRASEEQIKALTQQAQSSKGGKQKGKGPFNLLQSRPVHSNKYGQFFEVTPNDYEQLRDMNSSISFIKLNQGGMMAPYYNSKSTKIVNVVEGYGYFEMACPHVASQSHGPQTREGVTESTSYKRLYAHLSPGDALVIPAGHPVTFIADQNQNLQLVSFGINSRNNKRNFFAGQENVLNQLEKEAKELSFNTKAEEVEEILKNQKDSYFVAGPKEFEEREEKGGRGPTLVFNYGLGGV